MGTYSVLKNKVKCIIRAGRNGWQNSITGWRLYNWVWSEDKFDNGKETIIRKLLSIRSRSGFIFFLPTPLLAWQCLRLHYNWSNWHNSRLRDRGRARETYRQILKQTERVIHTDGDRQRHADREWKWDPVLNSTSKLH